MHKVLLKAFVDSARLLPFLFLTYLVTEVLFRAAGEKTTKIIQNTGKIGPVWGGICGAFPECGFSATASYFYSKKLITLGTLISVYMSTSDEMLPVLISQQVKLVVIVKIVLTKALIGIISGLIVQILFGRFLKINRMEKAFKADDFSSHSLYRGIFEEALLHSVKVWFFIFLVSAGIDLAFHFIGENFSRSLFFDAPVLGELLAGLIGLLPSCATSVLITQLYLKKIIGPGPMISGLLTCAGVGTLVLYKENRHMRENILILAILYASGAFWGILFDLCDFNF